MEFADKFVHTSLFIYKKKSKLKIEFPQSIPLTQIEIMIRVKIYLPKSNALFMNKFEIQQDPKGQSITFLITPHTTIQLSCINGENSIRKVRVFPLAAAATWNFS